MTKRPRDDDDELIVSRTLAAAVGTYLAAFGDAPVPASAEELLERADALGPFVQNPLAEALHFIAWDRFVDAVRAAQATGGGRAPH